MSTSDENLKKKAYVKPEITSCEVEQGAYACGSTPGNTAKWLEWCLFFSCCDHNVLPFWRGCH